MRYQETLYKEWGQSFEQGEILYEMQTQHQHLIIFQNAKFGRVLALDGVIQTTESDEFIYHEMIVHVPMCTHVEPKNILIIGGGDGAVLREVLKHPSVSLVTQIEIDKRVIDMSIKYLPEHSAGAFDDPRLRLVIDDGASFLAHNRDQFDIIIIDSTDPIGPGAPLYEQSFYFDCARALAKDGILVTQNGVPFMQADEIAQTFRKWEALFTTRKFYLTTVPTYAGGPMAMGFAAKKKVNLPSIETLKDRVNKLGALRYYTPSIHHSSFSLPQYVANLIFN